MTEYDILLFPTKIADKWYEVPRIQTCGIGKEPIRCWEDVVACAKDFNYEILSPECFAKDTPLGYMLFHKDGVAMNGRMMKLDFSKMVLLMLFLEGRL